MGRLPNSPNTAAFDAFIDTFKTYLQHLICTYSIDPAYLVPHIYEPYNKIGEIILSNKSSANDTDISPHSFMADLIAKTALSACDAKVWLACVQHSLEEYIIPKYL